MITGVDMRRKSRFTVQQVVGAHISHFEICGTHNLLLVQALNRGIGF